MKYNLILLCLGNSLLIKLIVFDTSENTPGFVLDVFARKSLWEIGKDYGEKKRGELFPHEVLNAQFSLDFPRLPPL